MGLSRVAWPPVARTDIIVAPPAITLQLLFTPRNYMNETKGVFMYTGGDYHRCKAAWGDDTYRWKVNRLYPSTLNCLQFVPQVDAGLCLLKVCSVFTDWRVQTSG
jgi:hypothetical protein